MLIIDNPAGVGYSYAKRDIDFKNTDYQYQSDILIFMKQFYKYWPLRAQNPTFIYGLSYGGMYAPYLSLALHQNNQEFKMNKTSLFVNLKGFIVGNGATDWTTDPFIGTVDTAAAFNLLSNSFY